jgi:hypothetical protein
MVSDLDSASAACLTASPPEMVLPDCVSNGVGQHSPVRAMTCAGVVNKGGPPSSTRSLKIASVKPWAQRAHFLADWSEALSLVINSLMLSLQ